MADTSNDTLRKDVQAILSSYKGPLPKHHQRAIQSQTNEIMKKAPSQSSKKEPAESRNSSKSFLPPPRANTYKPHNTTNKFTPKQANDTQPYKPKITKDGKKPFSQSFSNKSFHHHGMPKSSPPITSSSTSVATTVSSTTLTSTHQDTGTLTSPDIPVSIIDLQNLPNTRMSGKLGIDSGNWYHANEINFPLPSNENNDDTSTAGSSKKRKRDNLPTVTKGVDLTTISTFTPMIQKLYDIAQRLFDNEIETAEARKSSSVSQSHDTKWISQVLTSGTSSDKLAALVLLVQQSPIHGLKHLDSLLQLANKKSHRDAMQVIEAVKDLFLTNLLPHDRKLYTFHMRIHQFLQNVINLPSGIKNTGNSGQASKYKLNGETLVRWYFEDELKQRYAKFLRILANAMTESTITFFKIGTMKTAHELLTERPEAEGTLLTMLVNKLGDPDGSIASKTNSLLTQLIERHEAMKSIIIREVRQFVYQPNLALRSQYYGILFLNQLPLQRHYPSLAIDLISTYFTLFETCIKRNQLGSKLLSALLTGINRAFPYATEAPRNVKNEIDDKTQAQNQLREIEARSDVLFTVLHRGTPNTAIQALVMLQNIAQRRIAEGFDGSMGSNNNGTTVSSTLPKKSVPKSSVARPSNTTVNSDDNGIILDDAVGEEETTEPVTGIAFVNRYYRALYSKLTIDDILASNKHALLLNVVFKSIKYDDSVPRCKAILKRLLQVALLTPTQFTTGVLVLVAELLHLRPELRALIVSAHAVSTTLTTRTNESSSVENDEKDDETNSIVSDNSEVLNIVKPVKGIQSTAMKNPATETPPVPLAVSTVDKSFSSSSSSSIINHPYDPYKRDPLYANSDNEYIWELIPFAAHSHPSVRMFADHIMTNPGESLNYQGDPLADFSLMAFLDRYVFKNPKKRNLEAYGKDGKGGGGTAATTLKQQSKLDAELAEGYAIVQGKDPETTAALAAGLAHGTSRMQRRISRHGRVDTAIPASSTEFANLDTSIIREDDKFLHTYFRTKAIMKENNDNDKKQKEEKEKERRKKSSAEDDDAMDSEGSMDEDEIDAFADKVAEKLMQDAKGPSDDEEDGDDDNDDDDDDEANNENDMDFSNMDFGEPQDNDDDDDIIDNDNTNEDLYPHTGNYNVDEDDGSDEELYKWDDESDSNNDEEVATVVEPEQPAKKSKQDKNNNPNNTKKGKKEESKNTNTKSSTTVFADADDYAHLLESDIDDEEKPKKEEMRLANSDPRKKPLLKSQPKLPNRKNKFRK